MPDPYGCIAKIFLDASCVGPVNIAPGDLGKYIVSKDYPPEILLEVRKKQTLWYKFQFICEYAGIKSSSPVAAQVLDSWPHEINFIANGQKQTINSSGPTWDMKIIVVPVRRE
ncbi:MAG: hypothetical protein ABR503_16480 [Chitinophagaceae bacterium]